MLPKVLLEFTAPEISKTTWQEENKLFRIIQTYEGTLLEVCDVDALGNLTWNPGGPLTRWAEALIKACVLSTPINHDTEMLDWLDKNAGEYGDGWVCRNSMIERGLRLHKMTNDEVHQFMRQPFAPFLEVHPTIREAIGAAMEKFKC